MKTVFEIARSAETPFVVQDKLKKWQLLNYQESDWCSLFTNETIFRKGKKQFSSNPAWERSCTFESMDMKAFFDISRKKDSNFLYFDYKPMKEVFCEDHPILHTIKWTDLGVPLELCKDSTIWIGNSGAHTPCHMDTYGNNFVAQLYGRKRWLLIPPSETLKMKPSRVPYEESSIYSLLNFFTPTNEILDVNEIYDVTLEPGDVLFVPRHWWHYVENLEVSVSVNTWMPSEKDINSRLEEALVQRYVWTVCQDLTIEESKELLNPNEDTLLTIQPQEEILQRVIAECMVKKQLSEELSNEPMKKKLKSDGIRFLRPSSSEEITNYIESKASVYDYDCKNTDNIKKDLNNTLDVCKALINSMCHPETISLARKKLLEQFKN